MWESTLKKLSDNTALKAAQLWAENPINLRLINNQINCVYRFEFKNKGYYLRLTHENIRSFAELEAAIRFQQHLFNNNAPVCPTVPSKGGRCIELVEQDGLSFYSHVCGEVPGKHIDFSNQNKELYLSWGRALAQLHKASKSFDPENHQYLSWSDLWGDTGKLIDNEPEEIKEVYEKISQFFNAFEANTENFGLTHGDHRPGNVLYHADKVSIIDFDEPVFHWFMADIVKPFLDLCQQPYKDWETIWHWYLEGYSGVLPIGQNILASANLFSQMKSLDIYLWCKNNWFEPTAPGGKPRDIWLRELEHMALNPLFNY